MLYTKYIENFSHCPQVFRSYDPWSEPTLWPSLKRDWNLRVLESNLNDTIYSILFYRNRMKRSLLYHGPNACGKSGNRSAFISCFWLWTYRLFRSVFSYWWPHCGPPGLFLTSLVDNSTCCLRCQCITTLYTSWWMSSSLFCFWCCAYYVQNR